MRHLFGPFSNYIWRCLNVIKICAGWTIWAQITAPKWLEKHASLASVLITTSFNTWAWAVARIFICHTSRSVSVKMGFGEKQMEALFPCKIYQDESRGGKIKKWGGKIRELEMGGNGGEPQFCESVCVRPLPRKTRPERRWDPISAWRHGRKLVPLGGGVRWGGGVLLMFSQRKEKDM